MLSPQLRRQVYELWSMFWAAGMTNPLTAIEQITYLLFIKQLESVDRDRVDHGKLSLFGRRPNCRLPHHPDDSTGVDQTLPVSSIPREYKDCHGHGTCRWSYIRHARTVSDPTTGAPITPHEHLSQYVFPWLRMLDETIQSTSSDANGLHQSGQQMEDAYFQLPREKTATLQRAIATIDDLFKSIGSSSANSDIMGDIFEFLLSEIQTSGKNGQFRTPRHIIRFMIELLAPKPGQRVVDPAAGTAGFLINTIQYLLKEHTDKESVILEWDGTPHRIPGGKLDVERHLIGSNFTGFDNDRTMVRIGWMNMILHGIDHPSIVLRDTLGKSLPSDESRAHALALANPPFTGTVDEGDLHETRFPRGTRATKGPITNKTELLFVWLLLDLLEVGGHAAVIVPEGVLFGSTNAHRELRRQLLFDHQIEGIISLPAGVFQPYTGVKTSILVFQKVKAETGRAAPSRTERGAAPRTEGVWFYEVTADGYSLDAKRDPQPLQPNDLWDALHKWNDKQVNTTTYFQPEVYPVRWRLVDARAVQLFPHLAPEIDKVWGIHELFPELPQDPTEADSLVCSQQEPAITQLYEDYLVAWGPQRLEGVAPRDVRQLERALTPLNRAFNDAIKRMLEDGFEDNAKKQLLQTLAAARQQAVQEIADLPQTDPSLATAPAVVRNGDPEVKVDAIVREFAKLDGYRVHLRSHSVSAQERPLQETRSWSVPVRVLLPREDWESPDGLIKGSHDEHGNVRPEYLATDTIYNPDGTIKSEYLSPDCIEALDLNLSASRHKPLAIQASAPTSATRIISELQRLEREIENGLVSLRSLVEDPH